MPHFLHIEVQHTSRALAAALLAAALLVSGCSKGNESKPPAQKTSPVAAEKGAMGPTEMSPQQRVAMGKAIFAKRCASCHGEEGTGTGNGPAFKRRQFTYGRTPEAISLSIAKGRGKGMPPFMKSMQSIEAETVVAYVLSLK